MALCVCRAAAELQTAVAAAAAASWRVAKTQSCSHLGRMTTSRVLRHRFATAGGVKDAFRCWVRHLIVQMCDVFGVNGWESCRRLVEPGRRLQRRRPCHGCWLKWLLLPVMAIWPWTMRTGRASTATMACTAISSVRRLSIDRPTATTVQTCCGVWLDRATCAKASEVSLWLWLCFLFCENMWSYLACA